MPIILSGGGDPDNVVPIDEYFASRVNVNETILYIPVAMEPDTFRYEECFDWFKSTYGKYGVFHMDMCTDLRSLVLDKRYGAVFIGGGNTFKLLDEIKHSDFQEQIRAYLKAGGILYGGSAGAVVCGKTIEPAIHADTNKAGLTDLSGLDLLDGFDVWCHYCPADDRLIDSYHRNLYILYEESGLVFNGNRVTGIGKPFMTKILPNNFKS